MPGKDFLRDLRRVYRDVDEKKAVADAAERRRQGLPSQRPLDTRTPTARPAQIRRVLDGEPAEPPRRRRNRRNKNRHHVA